MKSMISPRGNVWTHNPSLGISIVELYQQYDIFSNK